MLPQWIIINIELFIIQLYYLYIQWWGTIATVGFY